MDEETERLHLRTEEEAPKTSQSIKQVRFKKEMDTIRLQHEFELKEHSDGSKDIVFLLNYKLMERLPLVIHLHKDYPFVEPQYTFNPPDGFISTENSDTKKPISQLLGPWSPGTRLSEIAFKAVSEIEKSLVSETEVKKGLFYQISGSSNAFYLIILFSILVRLLNGLGGYSGEADPPTYGDFQAHRNWMSLTYNRKTEAWYREPKEDIWWRLDYPPFAGYHAHFFSLFMKIVEPEGLVVQRGYESQRLKVFMRMTAIVSDLLFFYIPVVLFLKSININKRMVNALLLLIFLVPPFILIDHGHFQYNCVMLGLVLYAYVAIMAGHDYLGCVLFTIGLSTKQMTMYYALGLFGILLGKALFNNRVISPTYKLSLTKYNLVAFGTQVASYGWMVIFTTFVLWSPWVSWNQPQLILEPLRAVFPVHRGLYQLKVGNFWCITEVLMKWQARFSQDRLVGMCAILSLLASLPSVVAAVVAPRSKVYILSLFNISLSFFFFSYHVHQKSILVPLLFVALGWKQFGWLAFDFIILSTFSLYDLLSHDGQKLQYFVILFLYFMVARQAVPFLQQMKYVDQDALVPAAQELQNNPIQLIAKASISLIDVFNTVYFKFLRYAMYFGMILLHLAKGHVRPPTNLQYLHQLLFAFLAFIGYLSIYVVANCKMILAVANHINEAVGKAQKKQ